MKVALNTINLKKNIIKIMKKRGWLINLYRRGKNLLNLYIVIDQFLFFSMAYLPSLYPDPMLIPSFLKTNFFFQPLSNFIQTKTFLPLTFHIQCLPLIRTSLLQWMSPRGRDGIPSTGFTPPLVCACPKTKSGFPVSYVMIFVLCSMSWGKMWLFILLILVE